MRHRMHRNDTRMMRPKGRHPPRLEGVRGLHHITPRPEDRSAVTEVPSSSDSRETRASRRSAILRVKIQRSEGASSGCATSTRDRGSPAVRTLADEAASAVNCIGSGIRNNATSPAAAAPMPHASAPRIQHLSCGSLANFRATRE